MSQQEQVQEPLKLRNPTTYHVLATSAGFPNSSLLHPLSNNEMLTSHHQQQRNNMDTIHSHREFEDQPFGVRYIQY